MASFFRKIENQVFRQFHREPPTSRLVRIDFWLTLFYLVLFPLRLLPGSLGVLVRIAAELIFLAALAFAVPLAIRWAFSRFLWKVRNRLIVTYLLMGLAPLVLFVTLAGIASYVFAGQFAIFATVATLNSELSQLESQNRVFAAHISHQLGASIRPASVSLPELPEPKKGSEGDGLLISVYLDGKPLAVDQTAKNIHQVEVNLPSWVKDDFSGLVLDGGRIFLRSASSYKERGHTTTVISSLQITPSRLDRFANGLGRVSVNPEGGFVEDGEVSSSIENDDEPAVDKPKPPRRGKRHSIMAITGGSDPIKEHLYDIVVTFPSPLRTIEWKSGSSHLIEMDVESRPSKLYARLFSSSLRLGTYIRNTLIGIASFFALLELFAFIMAVRLSRTITQSIHDLYTATNEIDRGNLSHRITVKRNDQLAALCGSFNRMTASLERLLEEQREKERLQNELAIAQEVQANLFPSATVTFPALELHGVCRPARAVSGDYYDFLVFSETRLGLALGDISGKGISAALLMATLHSAVRAYRFVGEELEVQPSEPVMPLLRVSGGCEDDSPQNQWFTQPGRILAMLNRHLYRSTQPEKYATLWLGHYEANQRQLTYSNGGQLPPIVLHANDKVSRLDCGGTVVGLLDNMTYRQESIILEKDDLLIAFSDGVTEPENEFGEFGEEKLLEIIRMHRNLPLPAICDKVMQALRSWIGDQEQPDDITLVLARQK